MNAFVRYVVYKPGQTLVRQTPFVDLTPKIFPVVPPQNAPAAYRDVASKYSRIGLSFHFSSEQVDATTDITNRLDNIARVKVLSLRTFLEHHGVTGDDILMIVFASSLRAIGVIVPSQNIRDFGSELPVASNDTPEGRRKNRRVEVWVRNGLQ